MKWIFIGVIVVVGLVAILVTIGLSPVSQNLSVAANQSAVDVLGTNYSEFSGVPELFAYWWMFPIFVMVALVGYAVWKVYKGVTN